MLQTRSGKARNDSRSKSVKKKTNKIKMKQKIKLEIRKSKRQLKCQFTSDELLSIGKTLAEKTARVAQLEADKKQAVKQFDAQISECEAQISLASGHIQSGYEYRLVDCEETLGSPDGNKKTVKRLDTNETVGVETLTSEENQRVMDFANEQQSNGELTKEDNELIEKAIAEIRSEQKASISMLQRIYSIGYGRAVKIMEALEKRGIVGPARGAEPREILVKPIVEAEIVPDK